MLHSPIATTSCAGPYAPYRRVGNAMAVLVLLVALAEFVTNARHPTDRDFISFWGAAQMALAGIPDAAYDGASLHAEQLKAVTFTSTGEMPFPYAPAFLLLVLPFGLLSFPAGMAAWATATFVPYFVAAKRMFPHSGFLAAAFPPVFVNAAIGQNGFVTAAIFMGGLLLVAKQPFAAGLLLGCLVLKPQLALMLPIALIAAREWRTIAGAAFSSVGILLIGLAVFGLAATQAWIAQMPLYASIARDGLVGWDKLASVYAAARQAGLDAEPALALHLVIAAAAAFAVWRIWRSDAEPLGKASILATATMLASPYLFLYDAVILVVPLLWLAGKGAPRSVIAVLWCLPIATVAQTFGFNGPVNLNPIVPLVLLVLVWRQAEGQYRARMNSLARSYS